ncbi:MAG: glucose-6-phosphate isomerase [Limisphaerales bacterium]
MKYSKSQLWCRFQQHCPEYPELGLALDLSRMDFPEDYFSSMQPRMTQAFAAMAKLEKGDESNPDEHRMVGHYWLRNAPLAPTAAIRDEIEQTLATIKDFAAQVHSGSVQGSNGPFKNLLLIGIGGSALGPQFVASALGRPGEDKLALFSFDNTDPDGIDRVLAQIGPGLGQTLVLVVSKSGSTPETRNGMIEAEAAFSRAGLPFPPHAVAVTMEKSLLDQYAIDRKWLRRFPMWDWVGGRTSELSAVGLLPAALQGFDIDGLLAGARSCDEVTRSTNAQTNPSALLALMWYYAGNGKGSKNMVILPYKDRLDLLSKYLQQLVMESLGKCLDLDKKVVHQGITVLGNKGSTDQHSYVQQLRDGLDNFFVTFVEVLRDRKNQEVMVDENATSGDYLSGLLLGTRTALFDSGRESVTLTIRDVSPFHIGVLIALFERAVGFYASLINVNAYHQPGVQAGKKAAQGILDLQKTVLHHLCGVPGGATVDQIASALGLNDEAEAIFKICEHLSANPDRGVRKTAGPSRFKAQYRIAQA